MATKSPNFYSEIDELLACTICLERCNQPKSLPCRHPLCTQCLQQLINKAGRARNINCPSCRTEVPIPPGGAESFPDAFLLKSIGETIDRFKDLGLDDKPKCSSCLKNGKQTRATTLCTDCIKTMWQECLSHHNEFTEDHNLMECSNLKSDDLNKILKMKANKCAKHKKNIELYCLTCKKLICMMCGMVEHNTHNKQELETVVQGHKDDLHKFVNLLTDREAHYDTCINKTDQAEDEYKNNSKSRKKAVEDHVANLIEKAQQFKMETLAEIETEETKYVKEIRSLRQTLTQEKSRLSTTRKHIHASLQLANMPTVIDTAEKDKQTYEGILQELQPKHSLTRTNIELTLCSDQEWTRKCLVGTLRVKTSTESLGQTLTGPELTPSKSSGKLITRKVGQFEVPFVPRNVACMPEGHIVVCENEASQVSIFSADGRKLTQLQTPPGTTCSDVEYANNKILVAGKTSKSILLYNMNGSSAGSVLYGFNVWEGIAGQDNKLFITYYVGNKVYTIDWPGGGNKRVFAQHTEQAPMNRPLFVTANPTHVAVSSINSNTVNMYDRSSGQLQFCYRGQGSTPLGSPRGVKLDVEGRLIISDYKNKTIHIVSHKGQCLQLIDIRKDVLNEPFGLDINIHGQIVLAAINDKTILTYEYK